MTQPAAQAPGSGLEPDGLPLAGTSPPTAAERAGTRTAAASRHRPRRVVVVTPEGMAVSGNAPGTTAQPHRAHRAAGEGHAHRQHDQAVARGGAQRPPRRRRAGTPGADPQPVDRRARAGPRAELVEELRRIALPFAETTPSDAELRIAQAQLVGWLEGLFHGIQTALFAQQMAARAQLEQMRRALPGAPAGRGGEGPPHHGPVPLTPLRGCSAAQDPLGQGVWRRAHDRFRRAVDRFTSCSTACRRARSATASRQRPRAGALLDEVTTCAWRAAARSQRGRGPAGRARRRAARRPPRPRASRHRSARRPARRSCSPSWRCARSATTRPAPRATPRRGPCSRYRSGRHAHTLVLGANEG
jgi:hypothetical protein